MGTAKRGTVNSLTQIYLNNVIRTVIVHAVTELASSFVESSCRAVWQSKECMQIKKNLIHMLSNPDFRSHLRQCVRELTSPRVAWSAN